MLIGDTNKLVPRKTSQGSLILLVRKGVFPNCGFAAPSVVRLRLTVNSSFLLRLCLRQTAEA